MFDKYKKKYEDEGLKNEMWITADGERATPPPKNPSTKLSDTLGTPTTATPGDGVQGGWQGTLNDTINKILNREKFSYNFNEDALYQQYKDMFGRQAKASAENAIGQASALTGGYGNSYAQSVGQQMYSKEMQGLNDVIPELYELAYNKYQQEGQDLYNQYGLLSAERDFDYQKYLDERNFDYQVGRDAVSDYQWLLGQTGDDTASQYKAVTTSVLNDINAFGNNFEGLANYINNLVAMGYDPDVLTDIYISHVDADNKAKTDALTAFGNDRTTLTYINPNTGETEYFDEASFRKKLEEMYPDAPKEYIELLVLEYKEKAKENK